MEIHYSIQLILTIELIIHMIGPLILTVNYVYAKNNNWIIKDFKGAPAYESTLSPYFSTTLVILLSNHFLPYFELCLVYINLT